MTLLLEGMVLVAIVVLVVLAVQLRQTQARQAKMEHLLDALVDKSQHHEQQLRQIDRKIEQVWDGLGTRVGEVRDELAQQSGQRMVDALYQLAQDMPNFDKKLDLLISRSPSGTYADSPQEEPRGHDSSR